MSSNGRLLRKLRKVMGAAVTLPSLVACSSQVSHAGGVYATFYPLSELLNFFGDGVIDDSWKSSFGHKPIKYVIINGGITKIGECTFCDCVKLERIKLPNTLESIGDLAFSGCKNLRSITIPESVKELGIGAFLGCENLRSITIPESVKELGDQAFSDCKSLEEITIPSSIEDIASGLFFGCKNLKAVKIPSPIEYIGCSAFRNCENLSKIEFYSPTDDFKREPELKYPNDPKGRAKYYVENCPEKWRYFGHIFHAMKEKTGSYLVGLNKNLVEFLVSGLVIYPFSFQGCKKLKKISLPLNTRFDVGEENVSPVTIDDIILRSDKLKKPCGCCFARCSKLSDFFEPNMEVEIGGKTYRVE